MALTQISSGGIKDTTIATADIADDAVTADKLANAINTDIAAKAVLTGSTNNQITTVTSANNIQGESNLTYDGDILSVGTGSGGAVLKVQGAEGGNAEIWLQADEGDDNADNWLIYHNASDNKLKFASKPTGSYVDKLIFDIDGNIGFNRTNVNAGDSSTQTSTATPKRIVFNNDYSNGYTDASLKVYLFNDGTTRQGFTSGPAYDIQYHTSGSATGKHSFYVANTKIGDLDSDGLKFNGDTAAANALDDYETGSWTVGNASALGGADRQVNTAVYTKIGNIVTISLNIFANGNDMSPGGVTLSGLPFTVKDHQGIFLGGYNNKDCSGVYINSTSIIIMSGPTGVRHLWTTFSYTVN